MEFRVDFIGSAPLAEKWFRLRLSVLCLTKGVLLPSIFALFSVKLEFVIVVAVLLYR